MRPSDNCASCAACSAVRSKVVRYHSIPVKPCRSAPSHAFQSPSPSGASDQSAPVCGCHGSAPGASPVRACHYDCHSAPNACCAACASVSYCASTASNGSCPPTFASASAFIHVRMLEPPHALLISPIGTSTVC